MNYRGCSSTRLVSDIRPTIAASPVAGRAGAPATPIVTILLGNWLHYPLEAERLVRP
ncbi:hypothetical protein BDW69DRAFT_154699 [Aspergillus filifer]